jgi:hypothetical protein
MSLVGSGLSHLHGRAADTQPAGKFWRFAPVLSRLFLLWPAVVLTFAGLRGVIGPVQFGAAEGILFQSSEGVAIGRVAFGAFPLGAALFAWWCVASRRRISTGLSFVAILMSAAIAIRAVGITVDHALGRNLRLLVIETVILGVSMLGLFLLRRIAALSSGE